MTLQRCVPESPRWLLLKKRYNAADKILDKIAAGEEVKLKHDFEVKPNVEVRSFNHITIVLHWIIRLFNKCLSLCDHTSLIINQIIHQLLDCWLVNVKTMCSSMSQLALILLFVYTLYMYIYIFSIKLQKQVCVGVWGPILIPSRRNAINVFFFKYILYTFWNECIHEWILVCISLNKHRLTVF